MNAYLGEIGALITAGSFTGPFLGVTFSLIAIQNTTIGVASTLMALSHIFLLPISHLVFNERFGWGSDRWHISSSRGGRFVISGIKYNGALENVQYTGMDIELYAD